MQTIAMEFPHNPNFSVVHHAMAEHELLGYSEGYRPTYNDGRLSVYWDKLRQKSVGQLITITESLKEDFCSRLAAGNLLALLGDPRILSIPAMCDIPGGIVKIGLDKGSVDQVLKEYRCLGVTRQWVEKECPRHQIRIQSFRMARYPVTNSQYREFLLETGFNELPTSWFLGRYPEERSNHPVFSITPKAADLYVKWLAKKTGRLFRLPTEAEWEYAAAGKEGLEFPWGNVFSIDCANTAETGLLNTTPVGIYPKGNSPFGISDMAGNVEEYVGDNYKPYPDGSRIEDDLFVINNSYRIARGGSFARFRDLARTRRRHGANNLSPVYAMGFRVAEDCS